MSIQTADEASNFLRLIAEAVTDQSKRMLIKTRAVELGIKQAEGAVRMAIFLQAVCSVRCDRHPESSLRPYSTDPNPLLASITVFGDDPEVQTQIAAIRAGMKQ